MPSRLAAVRPVQPSPGDVLGLAWFNGLTEYQRCLWLTRAGSAAPADAYALFVATLAKHPSSPTAAQPRA